MTISLCHTVNVGVHVGKIYSIKIIHFLLFFLISLLYGFHLSSFIYILHTYYVYYITLQSTHTVIYVNQNDLLKKKHMRRNASS